MKALLGWLRPVLETEHLWISVLNDTWKCWCRNPAWSYAISYTKERYVPEARQTSDLQPILPFCFVFRSVSTSVINTTIWKIKPIFMEALSFSLFLWHIFVILLSPLVRIVLQIGWYETSVDFWYIWTNCVWNMPPSSWWINKEKVIFFNLSEESSCNFLS